MVEQAPPAAGGRSRTRLVVQIVLSLVLAAKSVTWRPAPACRLGWPPPPWFCSGCICCISSSAPATLSYSHVLHSLAEWSDSLAAGGVLAAQGIDRGRTCHLVRRTSVTSPSTVERDLQKRPSAQRFLTFC
jgi:hypothetical protein